MYDAWNLIAAELEISRETLLHRLVNDYPRLSRQLDQTELYRHDIPLVLAKDMFQHGAEAPLLTAGQDLKENLGSLAHRLRQNPEGMEHPMLQSGARVTEFMRRKIIHRMEKIRDRIVRNDASVFKSFYSELEKKQDLAEITECLEEIIASTLSSPDIIAALITPESVSRGVSLMEDAVNAALVSMVGIKTHKRTCTLAGSVHQHMIDMGTAALFQDISLFMEPEHFDVGDTTSHAERSAAIAAEQGLGDHIVEAILNHHRTMDNKGRPILLHNDQEVSLFERILVAVNQFIDCLSPHGLNLSTDQTVYALSSLASGQFLDAMTVKMLTALCVGELKSYMLTNALELVKRCPHYALARPHVWDMNAETPSKILCQNRDCRFCSPLPTVINRGFTYRLHGVEITMPAGVYYQCSRLTGIMNHMIELLRQQRRSN